MWRENDLQTHGDGVKHLHHPKLGVIALEYSAFAIDAWPDPSLPGYNPAASADRTRIELLIEGTPALAAA